MTKVLQTGAAQPGPRFTTVIPARIKRSAKRRLGESEGRRRSHAGQRPGTASTREPGPGLAIRATKNRLRGRFSAQHMVAMGGIEPPTSGL